MTGGKNVRGEECPAFGGNGDSGRDTCNYFVSNQHFEIGKKLSVFWLTIFESVRSPSNMMCHEDV